MKFTRKGRHKLYALKGVAATFISEHNDQNEAFERAYVHAQAQVNGVYKYRIVPAELELEVSTLSRVVFDPDTAPPSTPTGVTATGQSSTSIRITWNASTDTGGSGLAGYRVLRSATSGGTYAQVGSDLTTASLSFDDTGLASGATWFYRVVAFDAAGNVSAQSATASGTSLDTNAPTAPVISATTVSSSTINIGLVTASSDNVAVARYEIERSNNGTSGWSVLTTNATFPYSATGLSASTQYFFRARAVDTSNNVGAYSGVANATTQASTGGSVQTYFTANFSNPNANGSNIYNFTTRSANNIGGLSGGGSDGQQNWSATHLTNGGYGGNPALQLTMFAGRMQYPMLYTTPANGASWATGDEIVFRVRFKFSDGFQFADPWRNKFILHGSTGTNPNSRVICYLLHRNSNLGGLGWQNFVEGAPFPSGSYFPFSIPSYFGLTGNNDWSNFGSRFGSIDCRQNISYASSGPVCLTQRLDPIQPRPGPAGAGAPPVDGWYHIQFAARSGNQTGMLTRVWVNNNQANNPTAVQTIFPTNENGLGVTNWSGSTDIGGYVDNPVPQNQSIIISAFEVGRGFKTDWYPG